MFARNMKPEVRAILDKVNSTADFGYVDFLDINSTNVLGDNALHCVIFWGDLEAAQILMENGIDIHKRGENGETPLHRACTFGQLEMAELLLKRGADPFARTEGDLPFTLARLSRHDDICELLSKYTKDKTDKSGEMRSNHLAELDRSIKRLEQQIKDCEG